MASIFESWLEAFRFRTGNRMTGPEIRREIIEPTINQHNEVVVDFGADYLGASYAFMRANAITTNRYDDYEIMDRYPLINDALDIIAAEATQSDDDGRTIFIQSVNADSEEEATKVELLQKHLDHFVYATTGNHLFNIFRAYIKYGDVVQIPIYSSDRSKILKYVMVPIPNIKLVVDKESYSITKYFVVPPDADNDSLSNMGRFLKAEEFRPDDIYHYSLDPESSNYFPYGRSVLDAASYTFKQLRLMEEAILVYRITRAPERRVFYIDVGELPPAKAEQYINNIRSKFVRKAFFNPQTGEVNNEYNPLSMQEDLYIPRRPNGAETQVETLPGAQNLDQLGDVNYFKNHLIQALKIPPTYLNTENGAQYVDGRVGIAYIAEIRFANYIESLQRGFIEQMERYFRRYLKRRGVEVDVQFTLRMHPPSSYKEYKNNELFLSRISNYSQLSGNEEFSKEFLMEKFLRLTPEEIQRNMELLKKEKEEEKEETEQPEDIPQGFEGPPDEEEIDNEEQGSEETDENQ